jgi:catechol 2,3-dioxygenase-like lactoylglutathione lyase family enzyme
MKLDHATIVTDDVEGMRQFFCTVAGLSEGARPAFDVNGFWLYANDHPLIHLIEDTDPTAAGSTAPRIDHVALRVDSPKEWAALLDRLQRNRVPFQQAQVPSTGELQLFVQPSAGVTIEFVAQPRADEVMINDGAWARDPPSPIGSGHDLSQSFWRVREQFAGEYANDFRIVVKGAPQPLDTSVCHEVFSIGREALINAFRHAGARSVEMQIDFGPSDLRLRVSDDGIGIKETTLAASGASGHWGLQGMRERAAKIGAHLRISSAPGSGTEVELRVPTAMAYVGDRPARWWQWRRGLCRG